jgi:hypothetical protein
MNKIVIKHEPEKYENIFNMYELTNDNNDSYVFYNILSKIEIPDNLDEQIFDYYKIDSEMPLTTISYNIYQTQHLWWLIMAINKIRNPVKLLERGSIIKIINVDYLDIILDSIKQKL